MLDEGFCFPQDTFLDADHLKQSFPEYDVEFRENADGKAVRPFRITFPEQPSQEQSASKGKRKVKGPCALSVGPVAGVLPHPCYLSEHRMSCAQAHTAGHWSTCQIWSCTSVASWLCWAHEL